MSTMNQYPFEQKVDIVARLLSGEDLSKIGYPSYYIRNWSHGKRVLTAAADRLGIAYEAALELRNQRTKERLEMGRKKFSYI